MCTPRWAPCMLRQLQSEREADVYHLEDRTLDSLYQFEQQLHQTESQKKSVIQTAEQRREAAEEDASSLSEELSRKSEGLRELEQLRKGGGLELKLPSTLSKSSRNK